MKKWQKRSLWLLLVLGVAAGLWWAFKPAEKVNYLTDTVKRSNIEQTVNATGEVSAAQMVDVGAQASGQIKKLHVKLGQKVKKGDLIADIDATTQTNNLNTNRARLDTYQAQLASAQIKLRTAERQYAREQALWKEDATSKQSLESAEDALAGAKASVTELKSSIRTTPAKAAMCMCLYSTTTAAAPFTTQQNPTTSAMKCAGLWAACSAPPVI